MIWTMITDRCGYNSANKYGHFIGYVSGEDDYDDDKDIPDSMVGECRDGNDTIYEGVKLVLLINSEMDQLRIDGLGNELRKRGSNENQIKNQ